MYKFFLILLSFNLFTCEKPAPQKPTIISTRTYMDTIKTDSITTTINPKKDSLKPSGLLPTGNTAKTLDKSDEWKHYSNVAKQNVYVKYEQKDTINAVSINFPKKNLNITLDEVSLNSDIYANDSIKWQTKYKKRTGVLTINGTWFDFIIVNKPEPINLSTD